MPSSDTSPSRSLINAAVQSLFLGAGETGALAAGSDVSTTSCGPSVVNIIRSYHSSLVPSVSVNGRSIPRQYLDGPLAVNESCLDSQFDYDFTNKRDRGETFRRGNQPYERPYGSYRIALKVKDEFGTDNDWLGMTGDEPGEWPVSYHGTAGHNALNIAEEGFKRSKGKRFLHGKAIYSTPELEVAKRFARKFKHEGAWYKCVIQNRVNPKYLTVLTKEETGVGTFWLSAADKDVNEKDFIRPYGLCLFKV